MKTVKKGDDVRRVEDTQAHMLVNNGWEYCSKELWKEHNPKNVSKNVRVVSNDSISDNLSDKKKRKARKDSKKKKYEDR